LSQKHSGSTLPVYGAPRKKKKGGSGGIGTIVLLAAIIVLAVLIIKSAFKKDEVVTNDVKVINAWALTATATPTAQPELRPTAEAVGKLPIYYKANTGQKSVAVTVQGISNQTELDKLLGICATNNARVTFFLSGTELANYSSMWPAAVLGGHEIESRGLGSGQISAMSETELASHIDGFTQNLRAIIGESYEPHFFRPAEMTDYDDARLHEALSKRGFYGIASWSLSAPTGMSQIEPGQIINIQLDSYGLNRLSEMLSALNANGYRVVTLNTLFAYGDNLPTASGG